MAITNLIVRGEEILRASNRPEIVAAGSIGFATCHFTFSSDWDGLVKTAVFIREDGKAYMAVCTDDVAIIPTSAIADADNDTWLAIGVFGKDGNNKILAKTNLYQQKVWPSAPSSGAINEGTPSTTDTTLYQQMQTLYAKILTTDPVALREEALRELQEFQDAVDSAEITLPQMNTAIQNANTAIKNANTAKSNLQTATSAANTAKSNLQTATTAANTAKSNLDTATDAANAAKTSLETATGNANTAKTNLQTATTAANTTKTNLQTATTAANTAKSNLEKATAAANTAQEDLQALVDGMGVSFRPALKSSFSVASGSTATSKTMSVDMSALYEADIDIVIVHGKGVTVSIGGVTVLDTSVWNSVLSATDKVRLTVTLQCRNGIYIKNLFASPVGKMGLVVPAVVMGYVSDSTDNNVTVAVTIISASGALAAGCEGEIWGR